MTSAPVFDQALSHLREQGIDVKCGPVDEDGIRCELLGYVLTDLQIIKLFDYGQLNPEGVENFFNSIKNEAYGRKAIPLPADFCGNGL